MDSADALNTPAFEQQQSGITLAGFGTRTAPDPINRRIAARVYRLPQRTMMAWAGPIAAAGHEIAARDARRRARINGGSAQIIMRSQRHEIIEGTTGAANDTDYTAAQALVGCRQLNKPAVWPHRQDERSQSFVAVERGDRIDTRGL